MKPLFIFGGLFSLIFGITFVACQNTVETEGQDEYLDEITSLMKRYATGDAVLIMGTDESELIEGASASGRTSRNVPYSQFTGNDAWALVFALSFSETNGFLDESESCLLEDGAGRLAQTRFGKCVLKLFESSVCIIAGQGQKNGEIDVLPWTCPDPEESLNNGVS